MVALHRIDPREGRAPRGLAPLLRPARARAGTTMVELMIVMIIMLVALSIYSSTVSSNAGQTMAARERLRAAEAARRILEEMRNESFGQLYALYNSDPADDPAGPGTAPGNRFAAEGLDAPAGAPEGLGGSITFPEANVAAEGAAAVWELRENYVFEPLGMPRDLNGDTIVDIFDHGDDYVILPVRVRVEWQGTTGLRRFDVHTMLCSMHPLGAD